MPQDISVLQNANGHTCTRVTRHVVRLTSSWPWRCVGEAETPSSKGRPHGDAATTWCCKKHPHTTPHNFQGIIFTSREAPFILSGVGRCRHCGAYKRTAYQARTQSNIAYCRTPQHRRYEPPNAQNNRQRQSTATRKPCSCPQEYPWRPAHSLAALPYPAPAQGTPIGLWRRIVEWGAGPGGEQSPFLF